MKILRFIALGAALLLAVTAVHPAEPTIYPASGHARADLAAALHSAAATHKRILLDFGGNWCPDCVALDKYFHDARNLPILNANYVLVHVNVGHLDANKELAARYGIPLKKGVPALAVLSDRGKLLYSQKGGEFEKMSQMQSSSVTKFLIRWKPDKPGCSVVAVNC
jgi:thiol:disulfide interchange protein